MKLRFCTRSLRHKIYSYTGSNSSNILTSRPCTAYNPTIPTIRQFPGQFPPSSSLSPLIPANSKWTFTTRAISSTCALHKKNLPPRPKIDENEIEETFLKGSGPGGQKINKTNSAVQIKHLPTGVVVKCQATRSREQNRKTARQLLAEKLDGLEKGDMSRAEIKRRDEARKKDRKRRKSKAKYVKLEGEKKKLTKEDDVEGMGDEVSIDGEEEGYEGDEALSAPPDLNSSSILDKEEEAQRQKTIERLGREEEAKQDLQLKFDYGEAEGEESEGKAGDAKAEKH